MTSHDLTPTEAKALRASDHAAWGNTSQLGLTAYSQARAAGIRRGQLAQARRARLDRAKALVVAVLTLGIIVGCGAAGVLLNS